MILSINLLFESNDLVDYLALIWKAETKTSTSVFTDTLFITTLTKCNNFLEEKKLKFVFLLLLL